MKNGKGKRQKVWVVSLILLLGVFAVIALGQFNRSIMAAESIRNEESLQSLADQASLMTERRLQSTLSVLETAAMALKTGENQNNETVISYLKDLAKTNRIERIGMSNIEGHTVTTKGTTLEIAHSQTFQETMKGKQHISTVYENSQDHTTGVVVSVPIFGDNKSIQGVLYGVILVEEFNIYVNSELDAGSESFVHIIDNQGNYIVKSDSPKCLSQGDKNYFTTLERLGVDTDEIEDVICEKKTIVRQVEKDGEVRLLFFAPMKINNWCVVTVLTGEQANYNVDYVRQIVLKLVLKLFLIVLVLMSIGYYLLSQERIFIKKLNRELLIKDKIFHIAVTAVGGYVFTYNMGTKKLEFMNQSKSADAMFPKEIEDFPNHIGEYFPENSVSYHTLENMVTLVENGGDDVTGEICIDFSGNVYYYRIKVASVIGGENPDDRLAIGALVDVTKDHQNEMFLKSQIGQDPLTKTYNRAAAIEKINEYLADGNQKNCAFYIIDLDNFKAVNDNLGHMMGDKALIDVAEIIRRHVRSRDIFCRLGGDEFVVFLENIPKHVIPRNVESLIRKLTLSYEADGKRETFSASVGIALSPADGTEFQTLYEKADKALYKVKKSGKNGYAMYEGE